MEIQINNTGNTDKSQSIQVKHADAVTEKTKVSEEAASKGNEIRKKDDTLNMSISNSELGTRFSVDKDTKEEIIQIYNTQTNEVVKEIPPEAIRKMSAEIMQILGENVNENA